MTAGSASRLPDLNQCASEPIHIPGSVQPHGALLALRADTMVVQQASDNAQVVLGIPLDQLFHRPVEEWMGHDQGTQLRSSHAALGPQQNTRAFPLRVGGVLFDGVLHSADGVCVLELEPTSIAQADLDEGVLQRLLQQLSSAVAMPQLLDTLSYSIRQLTGFDRVVVYRFDEDQHGAVVAEARADEMEPFMGLHFPESDIPRQARELYLRNWIRSIPNAGYVPAQLVPSLRPDTGMPLDLSQSVLRSVSPVHLEYLANMGVQASTSVSLIVDGRLWGLISCGHRGRRFLTYRLRSTCETIGRIASLQIAALQALELRREQDSKMDTVQRLVASMQEATGEVLEGLTASEASMLQAVGATGAATFTAEGVSLLGLTPGPDAVAALVTWVHERCDSQGIFHTHQLSDDDSRWASLAAQASGVLAFMMPTPEPRGVLWFRPEQEQTVQWGGNPNKVVEAEPRPGASRLHPRRSFELWKEVVRRRSLRWEAGSLHAATQLRRFAIELDLKRQVERERSAVQARDELVAVVSHDLRNPLGVVVMQAAVMQRLLAGHMTEQSHRLLTVSRTIQRAGERMVNLLGDLLALAKIEAGRYHVEMRPIPAAELAQDTVDLLHSLGQVKQVELVCEPVGDLVVRADAERVFQVFSNLIGNAIKHSPEGSTVRLGARRVGDMCEFWVSDQGPGVPTAELPHLFDRYWQASRRDQSGAGLGLYIAKGIVEAHGGTIVVDAESHRGAIFRFTLPLA